MRYLLDTNICIYIIKRKPEQVFRRFQRQRPGDIGISAITYSELCYGVANSARPEQNQAALAEFVAPLEVCDYPADASTAYGRIRAELRRRGKPIGPLDTLIAAHAVHLGVVLVTNDMTDFQRVSSLRVESWV